MAEGASKEADLRVAFVYKFMKFIEWPNQAAEAALKLCVLGADADAKEALRPLNGQPVSRQIVDGNFVIKQTIETIYLDDAAAIAQNLKSCHMLYRPAHSLPLTIPQPLPVGVLMVADDPVPSETNVGIALARSDDGRIEFSISIAAANHAGVSISSQLLKLAKNSQGGRQ